jgi:hypothetical protein
MASNIPLGDIVAAQALLDAAYRHGSLPLNLIMELIKSKPESYIVPPGTRVAMYFPGVGTMDVRFERDGSIVVYTGGNSHKIQDATCKERPVTFSNIHSWLILSHLAAYPFAIEENGEPGARVDPMILLEVGTCPIVLRAITADPEMNAVTTHHTPEGEFVCEKAGMVEPITVSMFKFLAAAGPQAEGWIDEAIQRKNLPLLMRLHIALEQLVDSPDTEKAAFARRILNDSVMPPLANFPSFH